jgi:hypothetical protein
MKIMCGCSISDGLGMCVCRLIEGYLSLFLLSVSRVPCFCVPLFQSIVYGVVNMGSVRLL